MKKRKAPGELELTIFKVIQRQKKASVANICDSLDGKYAYTTVLTVLTRMHAKKMLQREKSERLYLYSLPQTNKQHSLIERIKDSLFDGKTSAMVQYLIDSAEHISDEEIQKLEKLIQSYKK